METYEVSVQMTFIDKIKNFWYHYKWHTIATLFIIIVLGICIVSCSMKPKADLAIVYVSETVLLENQKSELSEFLSTKIEDYNGNGKTEVKIFEIDLYTENPSMRNASMQRLLAELVLAENYFFLVDDAGFEMLNEQGVFSDISDICSHTEKENKAIKVPVKDMFKSITEKMPEYFYATLRINGEGMDKIQTETVEHSKQLLKNLSK